jgi:hypothetical protein
MISSNARYTLAAYSNRRTGLKDGKPGRGVLSSFLWFLMRTKIVACAVEMWESRSDFQGRWKAEENLVLVFLGVPRPGISTALVNCGFVGSSSFAPPGLLGLEAEE